MDIQKEEEKVQQPDDQKPCPVVAIGASAGGLEALTELLTHLSPQTGMAYVYVQHLDPTHQSALVPIMQRVTKMKVTEVEANLHAQADCVYVIPPNTNMTIKGGVFSLSERAERPVKHSPIDDFFLSLAQNQKQGAIGVLLSGTASDGALGLKAIKESGGLTFVQDETAMFESMPKAAIAEGVVDAILPPREIAGELTRLTRSQKLLMCAIKNDTDDQEGTKETKEIDLLLKPEDIKGILRLLRNVVGVDFTNYKKNTISRRIIRRMLLHKLENLSDYLEYMKKNLPEVSALYKDLLINVTHFFRDPDAVDYLKKKLLPGLVTSKPPNVPIRIWVPACSTGEEAFSLAMLIIEVFEEQNIISPVQIFATDLSETAITKARIGMYTTTDVLQVSPERLDKFFIRVDGHYRIIKRIRDMCVFAPHNIFKDPPFSRVDLISCCNLLIYLDTVLQKKIFTNFHYALNKNGYIILGKSETIGSSTNLFSQVDKKVRIYIKKGETAAKAIFEVNYPLSSNHIEPVEPKQVTKTVQKEINQPENLEKVVDNILLTQYVPPGVIVNSDLDIVQFRGSTGLFLEPSPGKASLNLLKMARPGLELELRNAVYKAIKTGEATRASGIDLTHKGNIHHVALEVTPLAEKVGERLFLIVFEEVKTPSAADLKASFSKDRRVKQLEAELMALREDMRSIVEEQEAANEELQSANEEVVSSNEELQSINEELETSKEELESSNEELMTINQELQIRNDQLAESQDYTGNVIQTIREAVIVLDRNLLVKNANKAFYRTFNIKEEETEGRLIYEVGKGQWNIPKLKELFQQLLPKNNNISGYELIHRFEGIGEKVLLFNVKKVEQKSSNQSFILIAIEDITEHRQAEKLLEEREEWLRNMANNVPVMLWVAGPDKNFTFLNNTWLEFTGRSLAKETGIGWTEGIYKDDLELVLSTYHASFEEKKPFRIEYRMKRLDGEYRWILNNAVPAFDSEGQFIGYNGSCIEIHDKRLLSEELEQQVHDRTSELEDANMKLERSNNELAQFAYVASHDLQEPLRKITTFSSRIKERYIDLLPEPGKEFINKINSSAVRMRGLIDDLLNYSKIARFENKFVPTDLNKVFNDSLSDFDLLIQERNAVIHAEKLPVVKVLPLQMKQLFHNLLSNALKFVLPRTAPVITIECHELSKNEQEKYAGLDQNMDYNEIIFKDNGIGFSQEFSDQIFVIFQRLNDKDEYPGTGIGLALCQRIVRNHNGEIFAVSEENKGAAFHIILPAHLNEHAPVI